jgi:hypothetical protein
MRQKAQVPLLILIIALAVLLVGYVYFLPLSEKCKLISMPECTQLTGKVFSVSPGLLESKENMTQYVIPDVELFTVGGTEMNTLAESLEVSKGWFASYSPKLSFDIHENSKDVTIFIYLAQDQKVNLLVNKKKVASFDKAGQQQIVIPSGNLKSSNVLEIYPSTPFFFWNVNKVTIAKVIYEESYTVTQEKITRQVDIRENLKDVESASLIFKSDCFFKDSNLSITLNNAEIANGLICEDSIIDVTKNLKESNNITFFSKGNYFIYDARISLKMKQEAWTTYYFDLLEKKKADILYLEFSGTGEKNLTVYINEKAIAIQTSESSWQADITDALNVGQNKIVIIPANTVNISEMDVY